MGCRRFREGEGEGCAPDKSNMLPGRGKHKSQASGDNCICKHWKFTDRKKRAAIDSIISISRDVAIIIFDKVEFDESSLVTQERETKHLLRGT